jgi:hypothetical protein
LLVWTIDRFEQPTLRTLRKFGARISQGPKGIFERLSRPDIIAVEGDMLLSERRDTGKELIQNYFAPRTQFADGMAEIDGVQRMPRLSLLVFGSSSSSNCVQKKGRKAALSLIQPGRNGRVLMEAQITPIVHLEDQPNCESDAVHITADFY